MSAELRFVCVLAAVLAVLAIAAGIERAWSARRRRRELENEFLLRVAMTDAQRFGMLPGQPYVVRNPDIRLTRRGREILRERAHVPEDTQ